MPRRPQQNKGGRPTKYSHAVARKICKAVARGVSRVGAAALAGISPSTLHAWQNEFPEFSDGIEKADARFEAACIASICKAGRKTRNWTANAWLLERKLPFRYGKVDRHLLHATARDDGALPDELIAAIGRALGVTGKLEPIGALPLPTEDAIDVDILPQD